MTNVNLTKPTLLIDPSDDLHGVLDAVLTALREAGHDKDSRHQARREILDAETPEALREALQQWIVLQEDFVLPDGVDVSFLPEGYLDSVVAFAKRSGKFANLQRKINRLAGTYFGKPSTVRLFQDFAPYSFEFVRLVDGAVVGNGGVIYHGPVDDGSRPETFSVQLTPTDGWSIHT